MSQAIALHPAEALQNAIKGIEPTMGAKLVAVYTPFFTAAEKIMQESAGVVVTDPTQVTEIKKSKTLRLALKKLRCDAENKRKEMKADVLKLSNAIDFAPKLLAQQIEPEEKRLEDGEKIAERMEADRKERLTKERSEAIAPFLPPGEPTDWMSGIGSMTPANFTALLAGMKEAHAKRVAAAEAAEMEREMAEAEAEMERQRQAEENRKLQAKLAEERKAREAEQAKAAAQAEALRKKQREELQRMAEETVKARAEAEEKARLERAAAEAIARKEREAREKAESEVKALRDAEEAKAKAEAEAKRKAAMAPDREKLLAFAEQVAFLKLPEMGSEDGKIAADGIRESLSVFARSIRLAAEEL